MRNDGHAVANLKWTIIVSFVTGEGCEVPLFELMMMMCNRAFSGMRTKYVHNLKYDANLQMMHRQIKERIFISGNLKPSVQRAMGHAYSFAPMPYAVYVQLHGRNKNYGWKEKHIIERHTFMYDAILATMEVVLRCKDC